MEKSMELKLNGTADEMAEFFMRLSGQSQEGSLNTLGFFPTRDIKPAARSKTSFTTDVTPAEAIVENAPEPVLDKTITIPKVKRFIPLSETPHDRDVMNFLVDQPGSTAKKIAERLGLTRQKVTYVLRGLEDATLVISNTSERVATFTANHVTRTNARPLPVGTTRREIVRDCIERYPGSTTTQIGQRLLIATIDVSAATTSYLDIDLRREGTNTKDDPFRWYIKKPAPVSVD